MEDLKDLSLDEVKQLCAKLGLRPFKAKETFTFIHKKMGRDLNKLTTIKFEEREKLQANFFISSLSPYKIEKGQKVQKVSFELADGKIVETVYMDYGKDRKTICVSSQVGCFIGCSFCATGAMGFERNLSVAEILSQVYYFAKDHNISNIVFMGMGEPFLNFDNVIKAAKILNSESGLNIASRKIVISTIGLLPGIRKFTKESKQLRLAWSLVAPNDPLRRKLIPFKGLPSIAETIKALKEYQRETKRRITIEYVVIKGVNDNEEQAQELARISKEIDSHINLIPFNPATAADFKRGDTERFQNWLKKIDKNINVTLRQSLGQEISGACGQLSSRH